MKGTFITFEGCEGVGKSRQIKMLEEYLVKHNIEYYLTREPGGTVVSEQIRNVILDGKNVDMTDECEALLYAAARVQLLKQNVKPKLDVGTLVLCDRYIDSSFAYQAYGRGLDKEFVEKINDYAIKLSTIKSAILKENIVNNVTMSFSITGNTKFIIAIVIH